MEELLHIDDFFSAEEILARNTVRQFIHQQALPLIPDAYEAGRFPAELINQIAELGILGLTLPEQYGGSNAGAVTYGLVCQELERGDSGLRSFVSVQNSLCMYPIFQFGSEAQKQRYLPAMARGEVIGCFGLTEPDIGSDPANLKTQAKRVEGGWVLNGSKMWITNAPLADIAIIWAQAAEGILGFIVPAATAGYRCNEITKKLSLRASATGEIVLQNCFVPEDHLLPVTQQKGLGAALSCLNQARYGIAWGVMGAADACYEAALTYTKERIQFGRPVAACQLVQKDLADMFSELVKMQALNLHMGRLKEAGNAAPALISLAKMNSCNAALKVARMARNLLGANGISLEYPVMRHMTNLESVFTYEGTDNIHHLIIGKHITGIGAF